MSDRLLPCWECGAAGRTETFGAEVMIFPDFTVWICSENPHFGGKCPHPLAYISADAWNSRNTGAALDAGALSQGRLMPPQEEGPGA